MVSVLVSDIKKPATCTMFSFGSVCKTANATGACFYDVRVECVFVFLCE